MAEEAPTGAEVDLMEAAEAVGVVATAPREAEATAARVAATVVAEGTAAGG